MWFSLSAIAALFVRKIHLGLICHRLQDTTGVSLNIQSEKRTSLIMSYPFLSISTRLFISHVKKRLSNLPSKKIR